MNTDDLAELRTRLLRLEGREAARGLLHEYATAADTRLVERVVPLFHPEAVLHNPRGTFVGTVEIGEAYRLAWELEPSLKRHFVASPALRTEPDGTVVAQARFHFVGRADGRSVIGWGSYEDVIDVSGAKAVFRTKRITVDLSTDLQTGWPLTSDNL